MKKKGGRCGSNEAKYCAAGSSTPAKFFIGITDLYFTPDLPSDTDVFRICSERGAECTDAPRQTLPYTRRNLARVFHLSVFHRFLYPLISLFRMPYFPPPGEDTVSFEFYFCDSFRRHLLKLNLGNVDSKKEKFRRFIRETRR